MVSKRIIDYGLSTYWIFATKSVVLNTVYGIRVLFFKRVWICFQRSGSGFRFKEYWIGFTDKARFFLALDNWISLLNQAPGSGFGFKFRV